MRRKFTEKEIQTVIQMYNEGRTQKEIANIFSCGQTSISAILKRKKIETRIGKKIIYNDINVDFFEKIDSEENAYFLGFLYADGCVQVKNNLYTVTLKLKQNDQIILEKFKDIMSPSSKIRIVGEKYSYIRINRKDICEQLISHGCMPNKSLILQFPTTVPSNLLKHFLRGYSDGDGSIYQNKLTNKKTINTIWKIVSTKQFCEQVAILLKEELGINCSQSLSKPKSNSITTTLTVGGNLQVRKILDWLYQDSTIYLPRKYEKYIEFIKIQNPDQ